MTKKISAAERMHAVLNASWFMWATLAVALVLRVAWLCAYSPAQTSDFAYYESAARLIASGQGYILNGTPTAFWPIGYPQFLGAIFALTGGSILAGKLANVLLYLGIIVLAAAIARNLFRSREVGAITALALALYPNHIAYSSILLSETLFTFLMLLGTWLTLCSARRWPLLLAAGAAFGLSALARTQGLLVAVAVLLFLRRQWAPAVTTRRWAASAAIILLVSVVTMVPYAVRNQRAFGHLFLGSLNSGVNLFIGNNPQANGTYVMDPENVNRLLPGYGQLDEYERNKVATGYALRYMVHHPLQTLMLYPKKLVYLYAIDCDGVSKNEKGLTPPDRPMWCMRIICQAYYVAMWIAAALSWFAYRRAWATHAGARPFPAIGLWIFVIWTVLHLLTMGSSRFHYPMVPFLVMYAASYIQSVLERRRTVAA